jgi:hypothetical protein
VLNCDRDFVSSVSRHGKFSSPGYPKSHPGDITCRYRFQGQGRERVQIIFNDIDLNYAKPPTNNTKHAQNDCEDVDSVTVSIFIDGLQRDIGVYCGQRRSEMLMGNDNRLEVTFVSRSVQPTTKGFEATYNFVEDFGIKAGKIVQDMVCGFVFDSATAPNGTFTSPNFPGLYPRNTECHYLFNGQENEKIYITFPYLDVEGVPPGCNSETHSDYIDFSNFNVHLMDRKMYRLCGTKANNAKNDVTSDGNFFRVTFKSDDAYDATGFEAFYQFRKVEDWSRNTKTLPSVSLVKPSNSAGAGVASLRLQQQLAAMSGLIAAFLLQATFVETFTSRFGFT